MKNIYVCGPTVYSKVHIGNMRPILTFDFVIKSMKYLGEEINFIHNITDIDDKIIMAAEKENVTEKDIADKYFKHYQNMLKEFKVDTITSMPKVVENLDSIIEFIEKLIENGNAYELKGNVWFDVSSDPKYGSISNRDIKDMKLEESEFEKKHPSDFALWKKTDKGIKYNSPWGKGRPGWHTECVVFVENLSNNQLDIHGGGIDLLFPHHENEATQYRVLHNKEITIDWKHVGQLNLEDEKMSKSIGNVFNAEDFVKEHGADVLRLIFLSTSYSSPLNLNKKLIESTKTILQKIEKAFLQSQLFEKEKVDISNIAKEISNFKFSNAMKLINESLKQFNIDKNNKTASKIIAISNLLKFSFNSKVITNEQKNMYKTWKQAVEQKNYAKADSIREELINIGLI